MKALGKLVVVVAPSGTGKSTLIQILKKDFPQLGWSISFTTRSKRAGEEDGEDYYFVQEELFKTKIENQDFVEWAQVHKNYYGTDKNQIQRKRQMGQHLLFDLDVQGADAMKECFGAEANVIFIAPPSLEALETRLRSRGSETPETLQIRLENAQKEMDRKNDFDFFLVNDSVEDCYAKLKDIVGGVLAS